MQRRRRSVSARSCASRDRTLGSSTAAMGKRAIRYLSSHQLSDIRARSARCSLRAAVLSAEESERCGVREADGTGWGNAKRIEAPE